MKPSSGIIACAALGTLLVSAPATAQDIEDVSVEDLLDLDLADKLGKTESASRTAEEVLRAPARVTTMDFEQIRGAGASTIPELLRWVPGVQVNRIASGNYLVSMRGTSGVTGNNVVVMIDGSPINNVGDGSVDWGMIPLHPADLDRIEVVSGPVSTIYGANAYTGVINLVTRDVLGESPSYAARAEWGADIDGKAVGALSARYLYYQGKVQAGAYTRVALDETSSVSPSGDENPGLGSVGAVGRYRYAVTNDSAVSFNVLANTGSRSAVNHLVVDASSEKPTLLMANAKYSVSNKGMVNNASVWVQDMFGRTAADEGSSMGFTYSGTKWNRLSTGADVALELHSTLTAKATAQANLDWLNAPYIHPNENAKNRLGFGAGGGLRYSPTKNLDVSAEVRADESPMNGKLELSYRGGAIYHTGSLALRATAASAYRSPTYVEVGGRFTDPNTGLIMLEGTPDLDSPRSDSAELSAIISPSYDLTIAPTLYVARYTNVMIQDFEPLVRRSFTNDTQAHDVLGAEVNADWRLTRRLSAHATLGVLHYLEDDEASNAQTTIAVPEQNARLIAGARIRGTANQGRLGFGAGALYTTQREYRTSTGIPPAILAEDLPAYGLINAMVEYKASSGLPLWLSARVRTTAPFDVRESAMPTAGEQTTTVLFGAEYRTE